MDNIIPLLQHMSIYEMLNLARELGIEKPSLMTRQELINELSFRNDVINSLNNIIAEIKKY